MHHNKKTILSFEKNRSKFVNKPCWKPPLMEVKVVRILYFLYCTMDLPPYNCSQHKPYFKLYLTNWRMKEKGKYVTSSLHNLVFLNACLTA